MKNKKLENTFIMLGSVILENQYVGDMQISLQVTI